MMTFEAFKNVIPANPCKQINPRMVKRYSCDVLEIFQGNFRSSRKAQKRAAPATVKPVNNPSQALLSKGCKKVIRVLERLGCRNTNRQL